MIELRYWRDLPKPEKQRLMKLHNIKSITFEQICMIYKKLNKC